MIASLDSGIPGLDLQSGDHVCGFYFGSDERDEILLPFVRSGLRAGDKCVVMLDPTDNPLDPVRLGDGVEVAEVLASEQLEMRLVQDTYLAGGVFSPQRMIGELEEVVVGSVSNGRYPLVRTAGETTWLIARPPGWEEFASYESQLNDFVPRYPQVVLCLYDLARFGGGVVVDVLQTHPRVLLGGMPFENPHYLTPDEFRAAHS